MSWRDKYTNRNLFISPFYLALCIGEKGLHEELRRLHIPISHEFHRSARASATTFFRDGSKGPRLAIVVLWEVPDDGIEVAGILVHEAVHVWRRAMEEVGEERPSEEFEAYGIQALAQELMASFARQRKGLQPSQR